MIWVTDYDQLVLAEWCDGDLTVFDWEGYEAEVDGVMKDIFINQIGATVLYADVDRWEFEQEVFDVGW